MGKSRLDKLKIALLAFENTAMYWLIGFIMSFMLPPRAFAFTQALAALAMLVEIVFWKKVVVVGHFEVAGDWELVNFYEACKIILSTISHMTAGYAFGWILVRGGG